MVGPTYFSASKRKLSPGASRSISPKKIYLFFHPFYRHRQDPISRSPPPAMATSGNPNPIGTRPSCVCCSSSSSPATPLTTSSRPTSPAPHSRASFTFHPRTAASSTGSADWITSSIVRLAMTCSSLSFMVPSSSSFSTAQESAREARKEGNSRRRKALQRNGRHAMYYQRKWEGERIRRKGGLDALLVFFWRAYGDYWSCHSTAPPRFLCMRVGKRGLLETILACKVSTSVFN
jgi:hypothetical protein